MVVLFLANLVKGSLQDEVDQFFQAILKLDVSRRMVTRSAVCQARKKISYKVFIALLDIICRFLNRRPEMQTYKGFRTFAIDGSTMLVPDTEDLRKRFGVAKSKEHHNSPAIARVSILHDVLNRQTYDAIIDSYSQGEQTLGWQHLETAELPNKSLILLDRGYVSFHLLRHILDLNHHFCVRIKSSLNVVKQLEETGLSEGIFYFKASKKSKAMVVKNSSCKSIRVRVLKYRVGKETIYLMTSLLGTRKYPRNDLDLLYHQRWQIEESFKVKKCRLKIEQFSGFSAENVRQDFHAKVFSEALASALALGLSDQVETYSENTKDEYCISFTQAIAKMKNTIVLLFLRRRWRSLLVDLMDQFFNNLTARVPGRSAPRKHKGQPHRKSSRRSPSYALNQ